MTVDVYRRSLAEHGVNFDKQYTLHPFVRSFRSRHSVCVFLLVSRSLLSQPPKNYSPERSEPRNTSSHLVRHRPFGVLVPQIGAARVLLGRRPPLWRPPRGRGVPVRASSGLNETPALPRKEASASFGSSYGGKTRIGRSKSASPSRASPVHALPVPSSTVLSSRIRPIAPRRCSAPCTQSTTQREVILGEGSDPRESGPPPARGRGRQTLRNGDTPPGRTPGYPIRRVRRGTQRAAGRSRLRAPRRFPLPSSPSSLA